MAASLGTASIEDLTEDLELHEALLQSLLETRPGAVEDAMDLRTTIKQIQHQLAQLRGLPRPVSPRSETISRPAPPQVDGSNSQDTPRSSHISHVDGFSSDYPSLDRPAQARNLAYRDSPLSTPRRERPSTSDSSLNTPPLSDRMASRADSPLGSDPIDPREGDDDDAELRRLLGLDDDFTEGQFEAEKWLEERLEQERRDEEFARRLQSQWEEPLSGPSNESSPGPARPSWSTGPVNSGGNFPPETSSRPPPYGSYQTVRPGPVPVAGSSFGTLPLHHRQQPSHTPFPFNNNGINMAPRTPTHNNPDVILSDSSDSEIAEVSPEDFHRRHVPMSWPSSQVPPPGPMSFQSTRDLMNSVLHSTADQARRMGLPYFNSLSYANAGDTDASDSRQAELELKEMLESLRPDSELSKDKWEGTPEALQFPLLDHQKLGLAWMKSMEEGTNKGGILADDMGLGKTMQAIALMVSRPSSDSTRKTTLIVAPVALMQQWSREIDRMIRPESKLKAYILHGDKRKTTFDRLRTYDVVLTTFGILASELKRKEEWENRRRFAGQNSANIIADASSLPLLGPESTWYRVIIDEAQCIKNRTTKSSLACCSLNSTYRWCMSGTPMMNNVGELHSLLKFLRIRPYNSLELFTKNFTKPLKSTNSSLQQKALQQLRVVLKAVLLRRTKYSKIDGKPILSLPPRVTEQVHAVFSEDEEVLYRALEAKTQIQFNRYLDNGSVGRNYSNILVLLLRLRQACCHPHLINDLSVDISAVTENVDLVENAKQFGPDVIRRLKENEPLECPVCIDAVENSVIFYPCGHATCAECFARISDPALAIQQGNEGQVEAKCPNCRAKIDPKKVTDNVSFKKVHFPQEGSDDADTAQTNGKDDDDEDSDSDSDSDDSDDDNDDVNDFIVPDDYESDRGESSKKHSKKRKLKTGKGKGKGKASKKPKKTLAILRKEGQKNMAAKRKYLKRLERDWQPSTKIEKALEILENVRNDGQGEKTIIFSQFTSLLDLLEVPIHRKGWKYRRYDGSMKPAERNEAVLDFTDNPECDIMLVSLKAGNSGLNLVAASKVIIFDPFWNPYIEEQAIDRAHRLGQMRTVQIHRILIKNTVEDRILELQEKKREIIEGALDENAAQQISRLGITELKFLFNVT